LAKYIKVVPSDDLTAMVAAISELRDRLETRECFLPLTDADRETLSWAAYGRRYAAQIAADSAQADWASRLPRNSSQKATRTRVLV
jgi:hypothetical protein